MGKKHFSFFQAAETGNRTPNSGVKGSGANHYPSAPALLMVKPSAFDVSEQSYGKFGRIYSLNCLQNNSQNYGI